MAVQILLIGQAVKKRSTSDPGDMEPILLYFSPLADATSPTNFGNHGFVIPLGEKKKKISSVAATSKSKMCARWPGVHAVDICISD